MFSSLTAFLAPSVSHDTRLAWTEHGGRLAKYDELVKEESPEHAIDYWIGSHGQADELVDRLRVLGIKVHDEQWIRACLEASALVDISPFRFSERAGTATTIDSGPSETATLTAQSSPRAAPRRKALQAPLMRVVPATPPTNAAPPVTPTRRSTLLRFEPLQALSAMPEDSPLSRASAGHSRMSTVDSDVAVELYLLGPPVSIGLGPQATDIPRLDELQASAAPRVAPVQIQQPEDARPDAFFAFEGSPSPQPASRPLHPLEDLHERLTAGMTALDGVPTLPAGIVFAASSHSHDEDRLCLDERPQQDFKVLKHAQDVFRPPRSLSLFSIVRLLPSRYALVAATVLLRFLSSGETMVCSRSSSDLLIPSYKCNSLTCRGKKRLDYRASADATAKTTNKTVYAYFVDGSQATGTLLQDTVTAAGLTVTQQDVVALDSLPSAIGGRITDGMGLAFRALSAAYSYSFPFTAYHQGAQPIFGLSLSRLPGRSELVVGGWNRARAVGSPDYYAVGYSPNSQFLDYIPDPKPALYDRVPMIFDSTTPTIIAPPAYAAEFWSYVPNAQAINSTYWSYDCASPPAVGLAFTSARSRYFNLGTLPGNSRRCIGALLGQTLGVGNALIVGDVFFKSSYFILDFKQNRIGVAPQRGF